MPSLESVCRQYVVAKRQEKTTLFLITLEDFQISSTQRKPRQCEIWYELLKIEVYTL